jgi:hypothetical protein
MPSFAGAYGYGTYGYSIPVPPAPITQVDFNTPFMELSGLVDSFATGLYPLTRQSPKRPYVLGRVQDSTPILTSLRAQITPIGDDEQFEPKGNYAEDGIEIFSIIPLTITTETSEGDAVTYNSLIYYVLHAESWAVGGFYRALAYAVVS